MPLAIFCVFTLRNAFFPLVMRERHPGLDPKKASALTAVFSPHPGGSERLDIFHLMLKLTMCVKFLLGRRVRRTAWRTQRRLYLSICLPPPGLSGTLLSLACKKQAAVVAFRKTWLELGVWFPSSRKDYFLKALHQDLGDLGSAFLYHRWLWAHPLL